MVCRSVNGPSTTGQRYPRAHTFLINHRASGSMTAMAFLSLPYIGSFQQGYRVHAEHPLEEVWSRVSKLGITDFVRRGFVTAAPASWDWQLYAATRIRQAVEF